MTILPRSRDQRRGTLPLCCEACGACSGPLFCATAPRQASDPSPAAAIAINRMIRMVVIRIVVDCSDARRMEEVVCLAADTILHLAPEAGDVPRGWEKRLASTRTIFLRIVAVTSSLTVLTLALVGCGEIATSARLGRGPTFLLDGSGRLASFRIYGPQTGHRIGTPFDAKSLVWCVQPTAGYFEGTRVNRLTLNFGTYQPDTRRSYLQAALWLSSLRRLSITFWPKRRTRPLPEVFST